MKRKAQCSVCWYAAAFAIVFCLVNSESKADYNSYGVMTVEWLADNSDVIAIVEGEGAERRVLLTIKGDSSKISEELSPFETNISWDKPSSEGSCHLLFVRGRSTLLMRVGLRRSVQMEDRRVASASFGVTQFGEVLLTASDLLNRVEERVKAGPATELASRGTDSSHSNNDRVENQGLMLYAGFQFPFESTSETFTLLVPRTVEYRDHYLQKLKAGDACERLDAIYCLSKIADQQSIDAITAATTAEMVRPGFRPTWHPSREKPFFTAEDVRKLAASTLDRLRSE